MDTFSIFTNGKRLVEQEEILKLFGYQPRNTNVYNADGKSLVIYLRVRQYCYRAFTIQYPAIEPDELIDHLISIQEERTK